MNSAAMEARTRAFYEWEIAGRGWLSFPHRVPLEPSFRPFVRGGHASPSIDDARKPTRLERLRRLISGGSETRSTSTSTAVTSGAESISSDSLDDVVEWDLVAPIEWTADPSAVQQWLRGVAASRAPIAFEVIGYAGKIGVRIAAERVDSRRVREQSKAFLDDVSLRTARETLREIWTKSDADILGVIEFGLAREFMLPLGESIADASLLSALLAAMGHLGDDDVAIFQVMFTSARAPWNAHAMRAVTTPAGEPFFADAPELTTLAEEKCSGPLVATSIRIAVAAREHDVAADVLIDVATALSAFSDFTRNALTPLPSDDVEKILEDVLDRRAHRHGALLSFTELQGLIQLPTADIRSDILERLDGNTRAAPIASRGHGFTIGINEHDGVESTVSLSTEDRLKHCYMIGASGTGKSTLLLQMALQDLSAGDGFAVIDPHGDLIDDILARIPDERVNDVIVFDPADEEFPIGFNILTAHSELERILLSSDLVSVFRRFASTFSDQMETVLANAILVFLERPEGGSLLDLRRFLLEKTFREECLQSVRDSEVVSYWRKEFPLLRGNPHASILTRLNAFLRPRLIRNIVAQRERCMNVREIMDSRKIVFARLSQGAIGEENAYLLGTLLVSQFAQAANSRQNVAASERPPFYLYIDEFHHFMTPSISSILSGARKYGLGLTLAHQDMRQIKSRTDEVLSAVLGNAFTRVAFRVGEDDARALSSGFASFDAATLQNLATGHAVARIERANADFNLRTTPVPRLPREIADARRSVVLAASRQLYATARVIVETTLPGHATGADIEASSDSTSPSATSEESKRRRPPTKGAPMDAAPSVVPLPGRGGAQHKYLQSLVRKLAEDRGFAVTVEKRVLEGHGHVDVALTRGAVRIACEISVTTRIDHEIGNLTKSLAAGYDVAVLICADDRMIEPARRVVLSERMDRVFVLAVAGVGEFLDGLTSRDQSEQPQTRPTRDAGTSKPQRGSAVVQSQQPAAEQGLVNKKRLLISRDAASYIGLAPQTLAKLRVTGGSPPFFKVGRQVMYDLAELDAWLAVRRRRSTSDRGTER